MKKLVFVLGLTIITLSGCSSSNDNTLVVSTWDFNLDEVQEIWIDPFEEATGIEVVLDTGGTGERYSRISTNPNNDVDVVFMSQAYAEEGKEAGLWLDFDQSQLANYDELYDVAKTPNGENAGPAYTYNRLGIVYNPNLVGEINSWKDIAENDDITAITIPTIADSHGPSLIYAVADVMGVDPYAEEGYNKVFEELEALQPKIVKPFTSSTDVITMMQSSEVQVALVPEYYYASIKEVLPEAKWVDPTEGAVLNMNTINITANSDNVDEAYQFIDYMISSDLQQRSAEAQLDAPVNKEVELDSYIEGVPFTPIDEFDVVDYSKVVDLLDIWTDKWNSIFSV